MAGLAHNDAIAAQRNLPAPSPRTPTRHSLPNGPCNFRDATVGQCGCNEFWDKCSADLHDDSSEYQPSSKRSTWCMCGHHACFHARLPEPLLLTPAAAQIQAFQAKSHAQYRTHGDAQCQHQEPVAHVGAGSASAMGQARATSHPGLVHNVMEWSSAPVGEPDRMLQSRDTPSQASTTGLPRIPSVCMLSHDQRSPADSQARHVVNQSRQTVAGLGLSMMHLESRANVNRQQSPTTTIPDDASVTMPLQRSDGDPDVALTKAHSFQFEPHEIGSPSHGILNQILDYNRGLHVDVAGDTIPDTYNPDDFIQSATEAATPSVRQTPDLGAADRAVQDGKKLIETLTALTSTSQKSEPPNDRMESAATVPTLLLPNSPSSPQQQLQSLLRSASPQGLQKLVAYLAPLHNLLNSIPNVANTMRDLSNRLDVLENGSFNYVQPEDLHNTLEMYEGRLIDVEHRIEEQEKLQQGIEDEHGNGSLTRRRSQGVHTSFRSNNSIQSTTSSALILAAMERKDTEMEIDGIKDRLDLLEAAAMPTLTNPWQVEVVLLPWGRDLRGIWFSPEEPMHTLGRTTTQDSEEWTQARSSTRSQALQLSDGSRDVDSSLHSAAIASSKGSLFSSSGSGWSSQAISDWASGSTEDWLSPKACGSNNMVYKRLQSRGFVRDVLFRGASARDIQLALSHAFGGVLQSLHHEDSETNPLIDQYPGLQASYIPLRKVLKESRLRFLTPAEMSSSALWSAHFLAAGVIMRVSGGRRRLYITTREAYTQQHEFAAKEQTWPELRQLPRFQPDQDSQMEGNDEHCQSKVQEADAKEACWQYVEAYDAPPASVNSSFGSNQSLHLSMRPADRQWRRSITPNSILKNKNFHPVSPLSEFHPQHLGERRQRTVSASIIETFPPGPNKRRLHSSPTKQSSVPPSTSRAPSVSVTRLKRRRVTRSSSPHAEDVMAQQAQMILCNPTPISRRSREPPSPFYSSLPALARSNSDVTSRPSQRSVAVAGKSTPFAYATPHSGPFIGGLAFGGYNNGGDTEPDDDDEDNAYDGEDGEQSWGGVTDGEDDSSVSSSSSASGASATEVGAQGASFSADDSGFGSDSAEDDSGDEAGPGARQLSSQDDDNEDEDDEDEEDVFDSLLDVLQH